MSDAMRDQALDLTFIVGGVRSGKSAKALSLAKSCAGDGSVLFVATAQPFDEEMQRRIATHKLERPEHWDTLESPLDVAAELELALVANHKVSGVVVIDCLTLWTSNILLTLDETADAEAIIAARASELVDVCTRNQWMDGPDCRVQRRWIVVSNEVGLGVVPPTALGRQYRDALGRVNQLVATAAREVIMMIAGIGLVVKSE
jgi:adenosylcobinamide kinase/adenosylcobinamide-phosphate guanylyltransferase